MPHYKYERSDPFRDHANDRLIHEGEVVEFPEKIAGPQPGFVLVDGPSDEAENGDEPPDSELCGTIMSDGTPCERDASECPYHD